MKLHFGVRSQTASFMGKSVTVEGIAFTGFPGQLKFRPMPMALISCASNDGFGLVDVWVGMLQSVPSDTKAYVG